MNIDTIMRTLHILSGAAWFGQVIVINFILIPSLGKFEDSTRNNLITTIFPKLFNLASYLSIIVVLTGVHLIVSLTDADLSNLISGRWGLSILVGGGLAVLFTVFHFIIDRKLAKKIGIVKDGNDEIIEDGHVKLRIAPRLELIVITIIILLMINASRGIF